MTIKLLTKNGDTLDTREVDLPLEEMIIDGRYDKDKKSIILTLKSGTSTEIPVGDLVSDLVSNETFTSKVEELKEVDKLHEQQIVNQADAINNNIMPALSSIASDLSNHREAIQMNATNIESVYNYATNKDTQLEQAIGTKQNTLVSGTNIKTVNDQTILGEGNIEVGTLNTSGIDKITNLTGHTWVANDVVDSQALRTLFGGNFNMFINFTSNGYNMTFLREQDAAANIRYHQNNSSYFTVYHGGTPGNWSAEAWKTIQFTGDVDAKHPKEIHDGFIDWLYANGTFTDIPASRTSAIFENGGRINPKTTWDAIEGEPITIKNGGVYIIGIGGYDGTNDAEADTLQNVINTIISHIHNN